MRSRTTLSALTALTLFACSGPGEENNEPEPDAGEAGDARADAPDAGEEGTVITPRFEPDGEGFYRTPWPSDSRLSDDGTVDLRDFPGATGLIIRVFRSELETIEGYSIAPVVFVNMDGTPGNSRMPTPPESVRAEGAVQLLALDGRCGERTPLDVDVDGVGDRYIEANTLRATPEPGFTLAPNQRYALVIRKDFAADVTFARPAAFDEAMRGEGDLADAYAPLLECLESDDLSADDVAVATVFTTQDTTSVMRELRDVVLEDVEAPVVSDWRETTDEALEEFDVTRSDVYVLYDGTIEVPIFQEGASPYRAPGSGGLELDAQGVPQIQRQETVPFSVAVPAGEFEGARPVMLFEDGQVTGAMTSVVISEIRSAPEYALVDRPRTNLSDIALVIGCDAQSSDCIASVGQQLGASALVYGTARAEPGGTRVKIDIFDVASRKVVHRIQKVVPRGQDVVAATRAEVVGLFTSMRQAERAATLTISSNVRGAKVLLNDEQVGSTPFERAGIAPGTYKVTVSREGFVPWQMVAAISEGATLSLRAELKRDGVVVKASNPKEDPVEDPKGGPGDGSDPIVVRTPVGSGPDVRDTMRPVSYTHLRAHET